jgi:hypothetical protein
MKNLFIVIAILFLCTPSTAIAENNLIDDFKSHSDTRWRFITDTVMGGVSTGKVEFLEADGDVHAHMTGSVSTENNGGFIQFRMALPSALPKEALGLRLVVRGNNQRYFVHLRTTGTILPWQYYQAGFEVSGTWTEVRLPFKEFEASGSFLRATPQPESLKSVGIVAFGRDHYAQVDVREVGFY